MSVLRDVQHVLIRATYDNDQSSTLIKDIQVDSIGSRAGANEANLVERCNCPTGYSGETLSHGHLPLESIYIHSHGIGQAPNKMLPSITWSTILSDILRVYYPLVYVVVNANVFLHPS